MSQPNVQVVNAPIPPIKCPNGCTDRGNAVIYNIKLSNGMIVTRPEDFPDNCQPKA
jgi:hypothetical protein